MKRLALHQLLHGQLYQLSWLLAGVWDYKHVVLLTWCDLVALFPMGSHIQLCVEAQVVTLELLVDTDEDPPGHYSKGQNELVDSCGVVILITQNIRVFAEDCSMVKLKSKLCNW